MVIQISRQDTPIVSVVMPAYNAERFIEEAVLSVINQTFSNWELIVIDDCSTDSTKEILERLAAKDSRIRVYQNPQNVGVAKTRNRGLTLCTGEYVALLDSDDVWYPKKLERQYQLLKDTNADLAYCSYEIIDENAKIICDDFVVPEVTDFEASLVCSVVSCSTVLLSREIVNKYRFDDQYYHEDLVLWLQLLRDGYRAKGVTEICAQYRVLEGSRASNKINSVFQRWQIYRGFLGFSFVKSLSLLMHYGVLGIKKYKTKRVREGYDDK